MPAPSRSMQSLAHLRQIARRPVFGAHLGSCPQPDFQRQPEFRSQMSLDSRYPCVEVGDGKIDDGEAVRIQIAGDLLLGFGEVAESIERKRRRFNAGDARE